MTIDDATPDTGTLTRRELRASTGASSTVQPPALPFSDTANATVSGDAVVEPATSTGETAQTPVSAADSVSSDARLDDIETALESDGDQDVDEATASAAQWADEERTATAFTWLDIDTVEKATHPADLDPVTMQETGPDLLADAHVRPALLRARWLVPLSAVAALALAYVATVLLWPLHEVPPTVEVLEIEQITAELATPTWPVAGSAGISVAGVSSASSAADAVSIASVTKVVTALMVLDRMPLQLGEQGPEFAFTYSDSVEYWDYRRGDQSALDVPVDGVLTEYQMLQGTLLGSANNYVDRLAREIWGSDAEFADAAATWLAERGLSGITIVTPSGFDEGNVATPDALLQLGERAMQNPVFAEIVGTVTADIPGAGLVTNTNGMLADPGVVGIKTGTLEGWSMLTAKDVTIGDTTVRLFASVLNQGSNDERLAVTRSLFTEVENALQDMPATVPTGTVVGTVETLWGSNVDLVTDEDATVLLWNGASADASATLALSDERAAGDEAGSLSVSGPVDAVEVSVSLADELTGPSPWWRLTHPLELLGVVAD
ncbi:D-alanyl-D-alanine carboxypeptidase family protein [Microbacterium murale]|uniref:D-alanyl-D-alanine carboxypeptidase (Penicillin-binding protein 5/6) n=1 Tax=Microbacterium murale TaxID=1081040 RepID=A0ABU0P8J4_9MICO|nr:D-alanyl-D-alanine carboxypeptidase [Microbacterium murale]MDQ0642969.1 D-alanyl-D-alanine carboxypeptidase (penicillin-binding protein 5/6) [Microbacterium murale]